MVHSRTWLLEYRDDKVSCDAIHVGNGCVWEGSEFLINREPILFILRSPLLRTPRSDLVGVLQNGLLVVPNYSLFGMARYMGMFKCGRRLSLTELTASHIHRLPCRV